MAELNSRYIPHEVETKWFNAWLEAGHFHASRDESKSPYTIVIPPPNVTGILHMGHALNNTLQDILIRYERMKGLNACWVPGTDHAGIATQNVVERHISKKGLTRDKLGREKFIKEVWDWTDKNGGTIIKQLKRLGASCDWDRQRFTLDEGYSKAVNEVFIRLYNEKLIYRGSYIINWCPRCQTALSDEEAPHKDMQGNLYHIKYPIKDSEDFVVVATTRPETMFGDTALAVNPKDKRYKALVGKKAILPIAERELDIITDDVVDMEFGTGIVKVTPFHDPNDFDIGNRHKLKGVLCINPDGTMNINATEEFDGMDRFEAREALIEELKQRKLLAKIEPHEHAVSHCYRCHSVVEPYFSEQWFVRMKELAGPALKAAEAGKVKFHPKRWLKIYTNWMENIRDWCISRQIWWGHRIPAWYCQDCYKKHLENMKEAELRLPVEISDKEAGVISVGTEKPKSCPHCNSTNIKQDDDVLDTWFSSWLWPFAVFGWPLNQDSELRIKNSGKTKKDIKSDLDYFYPTSTLVTGSEIIFFWVARMIMSGLHFMGEVPFSDVYIHGTVRDDKGRKMSKSLGNAIDPQEIIDKYGADALRFSLISLPGEDLYLSENKFEFGRNFMNKIWNASRFIMMNIDKELEEIDEKELVSNLKDDKYLAERWIISELHTLLRDLDEAFGNFKFYEASSRVYEFIWHKFCDWYIELAKLDIEDKTRQQVLIYILSNSLKIMHPFIPFITEEIWAIMPNKADTMLIVSKWPEVNKKLIDKESSSYMDNIISVIKEPRNYRMNHKLNPTITIPTLEVKVHDKKLEKVLGIHKKHIKKLARVENVMLETSSKTRAGASVIDIHIPPKGLIDVDKEKKRLKKQKEKLQAELKNISGRLKNKKFLNNAPDKVVEDTKKKEADFKQLIANIDTSLKDLK